MSRLLCWLFGHGNLNVIRPMRGSTKQLVECRRCGHIHTKEIK
jgi:hypothetical protein